MNVPLAEFVGQATRSTGSSPKIRGTFFGVPIIRVIAY